MPFDEKVTWVNLVVAVLVPVVYFAVMLDRLSSTSAAEISYQVPLLIAIGIGIGLTVVGAILVGIGSGISTELRGGNTDEIGRSDERDKSISRRGDLVGFSVASVGIVGVLVLVMLESDYFWIANAIYLSFIVSSLVGSVVKLHAYRRGF